MERGDGTMQDQILQVDENMLETRLDRLVSEKVEQLLNAMLDAEADEITGAARYERTGDRKAYRAGHYERDLTVKAGTVTLRVPKLKGALFESAVIERYRRREQSVEEALIDMYLAGVSTRQVDDISRLLWGERMPSQTLSDKLKGVYAQIDEWRNRPLERSYPYLFVDGVWHKRTWGGSVENVSVLVAIGVDDTGHRCLCSISCCGFSHDDFSGLGRACRPRNGLNWMVLVSPPERTGKDYDQHAPSTVYPSFAAERGIRRVDRAENTCQRADGA
jgi:transposase-like protein